MNLDPFASSPAGPELLDTEMVEATEIEIDTLTLESQPDLQPDPFEGAKLVTMDAMDTLVVANDTLAGVECALGLPEPVPMDHPANVPALHRTSRAMTRAMIHCEPGVDPEASGHTSAEVGEVEVGAVAPGFPVQAETAPVPEPAGESAVSPVKDCFQTFSHVLLTF